MFDFGPVDYEGSYWD